MKMKRTKRMKIYARLLAIVLLLCNFPIPVLAVESGEATASDSQVPSQGTDALCGIVVPCQPMGFKELDDGVFCALSQRNGLFQTAYLRDVRGRMEAVRGESLKKYCQEHKKIQKRLAI
ncbi:MAG: hypothetical protein IJX94_02600 [Clostridia bacterium]|nr:hypothetical protein [Clostridia bacterium]